MWQRKPLLWAPLALCFFTPSSGFALDPGREIHQYNCQSWSYQYGLEASGINAIAQSRDGYIWLGTSRGLVRFDGISFVSRGLGSISNLDTPNVLCLTAPNRGGLWLGLKSRAFGFYDSSGSFSPGATAKGGEQWRVPCLLLTRSGTLWLGGYHNGIFSISDRHFRPTLPGVEGDYVSSLMQDSQGRVWVGTSGHGLYRVKDGKATHFPDSSLDPNIITALVQDKEGRLWVGTQSGLFCYDTSGKRETIEGPSYEVNALLVDREGALWVGTSGGGLWRYYQGVWNSLRKTDGLANDYVLALTEDREGSLWVGTRDGLSQLTDVKLPTFGYAQGLGADSALSVNASPGGGLWVSTPYGAVYYNGHAFTALYSTNSGLPQPYVKRTFEARNGDLYVLDGRNRISILDHGYVIATHATSDMPVALTEDAQSVIVSVGGHLFRVGRDFLTPYAFRKGVQPPLYWVLNLAMAPDGALLVAGANGVCRVKDGTFEQWTKQDGLPSNLARWVLADKDGTIWAGLPDGIARIRGRQIRVIGQTDGLPDDRICAIVPDTRGNFWVDTDGGIFSVRRKSLNDFADGKIPRVTCVRYDSQSSVKLADMYQQEQSGCRTRDGRIWFPGSRGAIMIDPAHLRANHLAPPVRVNSILINGEETPIRSHIVVPPGRGEIQIQYAALSFIDPRDIRFRYRLAGYDPKWVDAQGRRLAVYNNLEPGSYTFQVVACNADGVWNRAGDKVHIQLLPHYYQTAWFKLLCGLLALAALGGIYAWRIGALIRRESLLAARVVERTAELSRANEALSEEIAHRRQVQAELEGQKAALEREIEERKRIQQEVEQIHQQLVIASRRAGQAEVASSVLHNVGNVLNSVNVSTSLLFDRLRKMQVRNLGKVVQLLRAHAAELGPFFTENEKGRRLPQYLERLADYLDREQGSLLTELRELAGNVEHIKGIVAMQQTHARVAGVAERAPVADLVESALKMHSGAYQRHLIRVVREYDVAPVITVDRHKVLQILVNIFANAKHACEEGAAHDKEVVVRIRRGEADKVRIEIADNGVGIPANNLTRIFSHGFTTRKNGHGFGLHSAALAASEMGGTLTAHSDGPDRGATFVVELPPSPPAVEGDAL